MSEYILEDLSKITWNEMASVLIGALLIVILWTVVNLFITLIDDSIKEKKKEEIKRICLPYKIEYERLLKKERYKEALKYGKENDKYLKEVYNYY